MDGIGTLRREHNRRLVKRRWVLEIGGEGKMYEMFDNLPLKHYSKIYHLGEMQSSSLVSVCKCNYVSGSLR